MGAAPRARRAGSVQLCGAGVMETRQRTLAEIDAAFPEPAPDWFGPEFQTKTVDLVRRWITGDGTGDPFLFMDEPGFKHFVPALARLAYGTSPDFLARVLYYLTRARIAAFSEAQRAAVEALLL